MVSTAAQERAAGFVIFREDRGKREYLLLEYFYLNVYWGFAKGKLEEGESIHLAALRELKEETNLEQIKPYTQFIKTQEYSFEREGKTIYKHVSFFLAKALEPETAKVSWEHKQLKWVEYETALEMFIYPEHQEILRAAEEFLQSQDPKLL